MKRINLLVFFALLIFHVQGQDNLMDLLEEEEPQIEQEVTATFKGTRLINGHTVETRGKNVLDFVISHRFGPVNTGVENFWGLDGAQIRLGLEYGLTDYINVGVGRSSFNKVYDFYGKWRALKQSESIPLTLTIFGSYARRTDEFFETIAGNGYEGSDRNAYTGQLLMARKFTDRLSLQLIPTFIRRNFVQNLAPMSPSDPMNLIAIGIGGRYKVSKRVAINAEYYPRLNADSPATYDALSFGVDIETGGHVFQLHLTNAQQINERGFIGETTSDYFDGGIHFGFNISRVFQLAPNS